MRSSSSSDDEGSSEGITGGGGGGAGTFHHSPGGLRALGSRRRARGGVGGRTGDAGRSGAAFSGIGTSGSIKRIWPRLRQETPGAAGTGSKGTVTMMYLLQEVILLTWEQGNSHNDEDCSLCPRL